MTAFELPLNGGEKIKVGVKKYRGVEILSIRKWFLNAYEQKWFPTTKGINLSVQRWRQILPELERLLDIEDEGPTEATVQQATHVNTESKQRAKGSKEKKQ
ncbi:transcriptional coactivator p15/PC4 family protein [Geomonas ferrireducens]|uniref:transcriptional coactivator p15/PC4 family protein n=1 Tax=Geomonas ferrireducens TaxID=2570227 RepID=UPI0010A906C1|nr:transcriptional coactivator p15/PC4 family protein [Geomonas ferrireducens]